MNEKLSQRKSDVTSVYRKRMNGNDLPLLRPGSDRSICYLSFEELIPLLALFCPSSWATGLYEDLIKQNKRRVDVSLPPHHGTCEEHGHPSVLCGWRVYAGPGLLDILISGHTPSQPGIHLEVLIAGSNDMAVGEQHNIYIPLRHNLEPDHLIHNETVLVNAYIEQARHNNQVIDFNKIGRRHFVKNGQHLSMQGKRHRAS
ncbi:hypothetical protein J6590_043059 [Homalodisca vitripennis]|nr:hypothetical protein J6590_043059 [Homalodisca vitripennis]